MATAAPPPGTTEDPLDGFSRSVREVASRLGTDDVSARQVVIALLGEHREYAEARLSPFITTPGRPVGEWLARVRELFDLEAVARTPSQVVDGRLTILALGRLDPDLGTAMREVRISRSVERGLGFRLASVLQPWALPPP